MSETETDTDAGPDTDPLEHCEHSRVDESGLDQCVWCGVTFANEADETAEDGTPTGRRGGVSSDLNLTYGPVYNAETGTHYDAVVESPPDAHLVHRQCYRQLRTLVRSAQNHSLTAFGE